MSSLTRGRAPAYELFLIHNLHLLVFVAKLSGTDRTEIKCITD